MAVTRRLPTVWMVLLVVTVAALLSFGPTCARAGDVIVEQGKSASTNRATTAHRALPSSSSSTKSKAKMLPDPDLKLLTSDQMRDFLRDGYVRLKTKVGPTCIGGGFVHLPSVAGLLQKRRARFDRLFVMWWCCT